MFVTIFTTFTPPLLLNIAPLPWFRNFNYCPPTDMAANLRSKTLIANWVEEVTHYLKLLVMSSLSLSPSVNVQVLKKVTDVMMEQLLVHIYIAVVIKVL